MKTPNDIDPICCPPFDPALWNDKILTWENKKFIKDRVFSILYMPVNYGQVMRRLNLKVSNAGANVQDWLCLSDHTSLWNIDQYLAVDEEIPGAENITMSGKFYCKIYEGPYSDTGKWSKDFASTVKAKGFSPNKLLMWYTTCPKCAKKYGKNYVAILSRIE